MARVSIGVGVILIILGVATYFGTGMTSWTALIPAALGLVVFVAGWRLERSGRTLGPALYVVAGVALLGFLGSLRGVGDFLGLLAGQDVGPPVAPFAQAVTVILCLVLLVSAGRAFVLERRRSG